MPNSEHNFTMPVRAESATSPSSAWLFSRPLPGAALIAVAALLVYLPSLRGGFILDDSVYLFDCDLIKASDGLYRFWLTTEPFDYWPVTNTTFWIEWRLWGMNPTGYHVVNLMLHVADSLLIWVILRQLSIPGAWLAAMLFAVHPMNVESVAWISQRKNVLAMLFFLLSILWYLRADRGAPEPSGESPVDRSGSDGWYWLSLLAFTLAMLSKGSVAILPLVLLLLAWWQRGRVSQRDFASAVPFVLVAAVLTWVNIWFQTHGSTEAIRNVTFLQRLLGAGGAVWFYLYKTLLPVNLVFVYPQWHIQVEDWRWWAPLVAAVVVTGLLAWRRNTRWGRPLLLAWLFFCVALLPALGFTDVGFMKYSLVADHYAHLAIIGVVALVAAGISLLCQRMTRFLGEAAMTPAVVVVSALMLLCWRQNSLYADPATLYLTTLGKNPDCSLVYFCLGNASGDQGDFEKAIQCYEKSLRLDPDYSNLYYNLGLALFKTGRLEEAMARYQEFLRMEPNHADGHNNFGSVLAQSGRLQEAIDQFEQAVRLKPNSVDAQNNLANALTLSGRLEEGIDHYRQAVQLEPALYDVRYNLGNALLQSRQFQEAIDQYQQVLRLKPGFLLAYEKLATAYAQVGRLSTAASTMQRALDMARSTGQTAKMVQIQQQLRSYRAEQDRGQHATPRPEMSR